MIETIHVVFKTHLDVGFTALAGEVIAGYAERYIPGAIGLSAELERRGGSARFVWTTGSWLIDHVLRSGTPTQRAQLDGALREGRIRWHALPLTTHTELMDPSLAAFATSISRGLDDRYGRRTIAAKMTDVPGHTIGLVPVLAHAGIQYLHLGVSGASAVPDVPEFFRWRASGGQEVVVHYARSYGSEDLGLAVVPGGSDALHLAHTGDNDGPPDASEVESLFAALAAAYPTARIVASSLDDFAHALLARREELPVLTDEIGDTWIHGAGADPLLTAGLTELQRLRSRWLREGRLDPASDEHHAFSVALLRIAEHTWGKDLKTHLPDYVNYLKDDFRAARERDVVEPAQNPSSTHVYDWAWAERASTHSLTYSAFEESWAEQRAHLDTAIEALPPDLAAEARSALLAQRFTSDRDEASIADDRAQPAAVGETLALGRFQVRFAADGSIDGLRDADGTVWADGDHAFGMLRHQSFDERDEQRWLQQYCRDLESTAFWAVPDQTSPGLAIADTLPARVTAPEVRSLRVSRGHADADVAVAELAMPDALVAETGAPRRVRVEYRFPLDTGPIRILLDVRGRQASRLPEATWFGFRPAGPAEDQSPDTGAWSLRKLGAQVDPRRVVGRGNRTLHAASSIERGGSRPLRLRSLDAPLIAVGRPALLRFDDIVPDMSHGFSVNLHNNVWGTNFRMWFDDELHYRFDLHLGDALDVTGGIDD